MKFLFIILCFFLNKTYGQEINSVCESSSARKQIENLAKRPDTLLTDKILMQTLKNYHLILAGETHFYTSTSSMQDLIVRFKRIKGANACVAFEFANITPTADLFVDKYVKDIKSEIDKVGPKDTDKVAMIPAVINEYKRFQNYFKPLTSLATTLQLKNFGVDIADKYTEDVSWSRRNAAMAENLTKLLKSGACSDILMFVGKEHLNAEESNLKFYLSTFFQNYPYLTINIQMTRETITSSGRTWNKCSPPPITRPIFFKSSLVNANFKLMPAISSNNVRFQDFSYTLLLP